mmetsp:Transcript_1465/g.2903  ORF Transcript_1465/g.2903 Transcript_1465/m.2903 type:complete len:207 (-) Transcript_1465:599-1219(-)
MAKPLQCLFRLGLAALVTAISISSLFAGVGAQQPTSSFCDIAASQCLFRFVDTVEVAPFFDVVAARADVAFTPRIRFHEIINRTAGIINMNKLEPEFVDDENGTVVPVSSVQNPSGVPRFSKTMFKPYCEIEMMVQNPDGSSTGRCYYSGIGHEALQPGQENVIINRCVRVWLTQWQLLDEITGNVIQNIADQYDKRDRFCIVFRT